MQHEFVTKIRAGHTRRAVTVSCPGRRVMPVNARLTPARLLTANTFGQTGKLARNFLGRTIEDRRTGRMSSRVDPYHAYSRIRVDRHPVRYDVVLLLHQYLHQAERQKVVDPIRDHRSRRYMIGPCVGHCAFIAPVRRQQGRRVSRRNFFRRPLTFDIFYDFGVEASFIQNRKAIFFPHL
jgi:hypothetical protein